MTFAGVDPGVNGYIAGLDARGQVAFCAKTPVAKVSYRNAKGKEAKRTEYNMPALRQLLEPLRHVDICVALEWTHARKGQDVKSTFAQGLGMGIWIAALGMAGIPYTRVYPQTWQRAVGAGARKARGGPKQTAKQRSLQLAREMWPDFARDHLRLVGDHDKSDALLLARYCLVTFQG